MNCENISDALGLLDEGMIAHTIMVRESAGRTSGARSRGCFMKKFHVSQTAEAVRKMQNKQAGFGLRRFPFGFEMPQSSIMGGSMGGTSNAHSRDGMVRNRRKKWSERSEGLGISRMWRGKYAAAVCLCLFGVGAAVLWPVFCHEPVNDPAQEKPALIDQAVQEVEEPAISEKFVGIASLLGADNGAGSSNAITELALESAVVPIGQYRGFYAKVPSADSAVLSDSIGGNVGGSAGGAEGWHYVSGHSDLQYLIRNQEQEYSLWQFQYFDSDEYPYSDVLELVYQIHSADAITEIRVTPARMDNTDEGKKIQEEIGIRRITDSDAIGALYEIISAMTCYGSSRWDMIDYGDAEAAADGKAGSHEAVRLGRYLSITTDYGNEIGGLKYTAVSDMFYEFSGIAYSRLAEEEAERVCEILGIGKFQGAVQGSGNAEAGNAGTDNKGTGNAGTGSKGTGNVEIGNTRTDNKGADSVGTGSAGKGDKGADNKGADNKGADNKGADNKGADNKGADNKGADNKGADNKGADNKRTGSREADSSNQPDDESNAAARTFLWEAANTNASLEYVTELQNRVSSAMINHELPFVIESAVYENPYRLHVVVTSDAESDLRKLLDLDTAGGVLEIEYAAANINQLRSESTGEE